MAPALLTVVATTLPRASEEEKCNTRGREAILSIRVPPGVAPEDLYPRG